jgi:hypothetical protein
VRIIAGHADDVALALEDVDEPHLLLGRDAGDHADLAPSRRTRALMIIILASAATAAAALPPG